MNGTSEPLITNVDLSRLLRDNVPAAGLIDRLKISFRPYICPFNLLLPHVEPGLSYFDIGCGSGMFLRILAEYKRPKAIGGLEVSERLVENASFVLRSCNTPLDLHLSNGCDFPAAMENYDWVFLIDVMHHVKRGRQLPFLEQLYARMTPGQRLLFKEIDAASPLVYWNKFHDLLLSREIGHERSAVDMKRALENIGFEVSLLFSTRVWLYPHYALLCTKP